LFCDKVFCEFPSLQILYLHGNSIKDITEVDKLAKLKLLRKLALHGNSVVTTKVIQPSFFFHKTDNINMFTEVEMQIHNVLGQLCGYLLVNSHN